MYLSYVKPRSHCPGFQSRRRYGVNRRSMGCGPRGFNFFKQPGLTGTHRDAIQRRLIPGRHRSSSGMNRISTVRPPGDTVANWHELCPLWRYGDSLLGHGVSRRRAGVAPVLADSCRSNYGLARWQPVNADKVTVDYGTTRWTLIQIQKRCLTYVCLCLLRLFILFQKIIIRLRWG